MVPTGYQKDILYGRLDQYLIQPIDAQFMASVRITYITNLFRLGFSMVIFVIALKNLTVAISVLSIIASAVAVVSAIVIYYSFLFAITTLSFWVFSNEGVSELALTLAAINRYPVDFFPKAVKIALYVIPLAFMATVPAEALLGRDTIFSFISPFIAAITFYLTRKFWQLGLRSYQSASS